MRTVDITEVVDAVNRRTYARSDVIDWYRNLDLVLPVERVLLEKVSPEIKDKRILDIGIGGGRTIDLLCRLSADYTGIDYMPEAVQCARERFPDATLLCRDARDLSGFADGDFDFVLFALNGIDSIDDRGRRQALAEIYRVLRPGGIFMFSAHNRDHEDVGKLPWQKKIKLSPGYLKSCLHALYYLPRHFAMRRNEIRTAEYSIINDDAHNFSLLIYYITMPEQLKQLARAGFSKTEAYDLEGAPIAFNASSPWIYYLARK